MSLFLRELSLNHAHEHIVLILDRAGWHTAKDLTVPQNITLHWLPPYSPELNPVEHLWDEIREKWFLNRYFNSLESVEDQLMQALKTLMENPKLVESICLFNWMIT
jgi:transposase